MIAINISVFNKGEGSGVVAYKLGISAYISSFRQLMDWYEQFSDTNTMVFTSLQIAEEYDEEFAGKVQKMLAWFKERNFYVIAAVSKKALDFLEMKDLDELVDTYKIDNLRLDYGFTVQDIMAMKSSADITLNTLQQDLYLELKEKGAENNISFMHKFYPRAETGNDVEYFKEVNQEIRDLGEEPIAFITGNDYRRRPMHEGLPTLEHHRFMSPYIQYLQMTRLYGMKHLFIGDEQIDDESLGFIQRFMEDDVIELPVELDKRYRELLGETFTIRPDSPLNNLRLLESKHFKPREDWTAGIPELWEMRGMGAITLDNMTYQRYQGEIQIIRTYFAKDERVNVIGYVSEEYVTLLECLKRGTKVRFVEIE